jgi:hypothetical protein
MLGAMRRHSKSFIIYLLFAMIIVVFVFTFNTGMGRGDGGCSPAEVPVYGKVGGHEITRDGLSMGMALLPSFFRSAAGLSFALASGVDMAALGQDDMEDLTPQQANAIMQAMEMIYLASDEAERMGFAVDKKELARAMYPDSFYKEEPFTGDDGIETTKKVFDRKAFNNWIVYGLNTSEQEYEAFVRRVLLAFKLQGFLAGVVKVEPMEAELSARARGTKVDLSFVEFRPVLFEELVAADESDIAEFIKGNDDKVQAYYDSHPLKFHADAAFQIAILFVDAHIAPPPKRGETPPPEPPANPQELANAKAKADAIVERFNGTKPLFEKGAIPIEIPKDGTGTVTFDSKELNKEEPTVPFERFKELAKRESDHAESRDRSGLMFGWQSEAQLQAGMLGEAVTAEIAKADKAQLVGPVATQEGYWLVFVHDKRDKKDVTLDQAKPEIAGILLKEKMAPEFAKERAETFLKKLQEAKELDLEKSLEEFKGTISAGTEKELFLELLSVRKTGKYSLATPGDSIPGIGAFEELFAYSFGMKKDKPLADKVFVHPNTNRAYVALLTEREDPAAKMTEEEIKTERESLSFTRDLPYFKSWLEALRQGAVEKGSIERTNDYNEFISYLQSRQEELEVQKAKRAARGEDS